MTRKHNFAAKERQDISRKNGKKGRGPTTRLGLLQSSQNARRHGLSIAISQDAKSAPVIDKLADLIVGNTTDPQRIALGRQLSEAQSDLFRIRTARHDILADEQLRVKCTNKKELALVRRYLTHTKMGHYPLFVNIITIAELEDELQAMLKPKPLMIKDGIGLIIGKLDRLERYERRALSKRNKALHNLSDYDEHRALGLPWP